MIGASSMVCLPTPELKLKACAAFGTITTLSWFAGSVPLSHRLPCDNVPVRPKRRVRFDLKDGSESQHDQENLASQ